MKKAICLTLWKSMVLLCVAAYLPTAAAAKLRPEVVLSADQLLEALRGRQISYLHISSSGEETVALPTAISMPWPLSRHERADGAA